MNREELIEEMDGWLPGNSVKAVLDAFDALRRENERLTELVNESHVQACGMDGEIEGLRSLARELHAEMRDYNHMDECFGCHRDAARPHRPNCRLVALDLRAQKLLRAK